MINTFDTIAAIATPFGESGIGIVRVSGSNALNILREVFRFSKKEKKISDIGTYTLHHGYIFDKEMQNEIDEVLVSIMKAPKTYTREDIVEINCHGGWLPLKKTFELILTNGGRLAEPGEFTKRALLNGRINIIQAEAVLETIRSKNEKGLSLSIKKIRGELNSTILDLKNNLLAINSYIEKELNFMDNDQDNSDELIKNKLWEFSLKINNLIEDNVKQSKLVRGFNASIVGRTNVGKSTLLNYLCDDELSIVSKIPGTTRDIINEELIIGGYSFKLSDTAGIKIPENKVEQLSIRKAFKKINESDIILYMIDITGFNKIDYNILKNIKNNIDIVYIINKSDLTGNLKNCYNSFSAYPDIESKKWLCVSAKTGEGIAKLKNTLKDFHIANESGIRDNVLLNERQYVIFNKIKNIIQTALDLVNNNNLMELVSEEIREALAQLNIITGNILTENTLNDVFQNFCIGK